MDLNLKQLKTFVCVASHGSLAGAAQHLHATQSAISVRIQELEQALGVLLLVRGPRHARLTPQGRALVPYAEQLLALASHIQQEVGNLREFRAIIRLGVCEPVALTWLAPFVIELRRRFPKVNLEIDRDLSIGLRKKLGRGEIDLALLAGPVSDVRYAAVSLGSIKFSWIASPKLALPATPLTPREMGKLPLISLSTQPHEYPAIERWLAGELHHSFVIACNDIGLLTELLIAGQGASLLPEVCCKARIDAGELKILRTSPKVAAVEFFAAWLRTPHQSFLTALGALAVEISTFSALNSTGRKRHRGSVRPTDSRRSNKKAAEIE